MLLASGLILCSLFLLYLGAEWLVKGGAALALRAGVSSLVVGLTVVAFGTSMPEFIVSVKAALGGNSAISIGNVVGSNIFNIAIILGISALITPLQVTKQIIKVDTPIMVGVSLLFLLLFLDKTLAFWEGILFIVMIIGYTVANVYYSKRQVKAAHSQDNLNDSEQELTKRHWALDILYIVLGIGLLMYGASLLVDNAIIIARELGMSDAMIGLTIVAAGTSMPELITSIVAALKKNTDIAIGNIVGSNIFNILAILGTTAAIAPIEAQAINMVDMAAMLLTAIILLPLMRTGYKINRWEGAALLLLYVAYFIILLYNNGLI